MINFDDMTLEKQKESVEKEINRMNLMIKMSQESLEKLYEVKKEVDLKILQKDKDAKKNEYFNIDDVLRYLPEAKEREKEPFYKDMIETALYYLKEHKDSLSDENKPPYVDSEMSKVTKSLKKITSVNVVTKISMEDFYKNIKRISENIEEDGSEVEVQYQFYKGYYSALLIGRKNA